VSDIIPSLSSIYSLVLFYSKVLDLILSDLPKDDVVASIANYLRSVAGDIKENRIPLHKYIISKSLTKGKQHEGEKKKQKHPPFMSH